MTTLNQALRTFNQREATKAALKNELLTRQRVEKVERELAETTKGLGVLTADFEYFRRAGFWGRLFWVLFGKVDK